VVINSSSLFEDVKMITVLSSSLTPD